MHHWVFSYSAIAYFAVAGKGKEKVAEWAAIEIEDYIDLFGIGIYLYSCSYFDINIIMSYVLM